LARNEKTQEENEKRQKYERHVEIVSTFHQGRKQTKKKSLHKQRKKMYKKIEKYCKKSKTCIIQKSLSLPPLKSQKEKKPKNHKT